MPKSKQQSLQQINSSKLVFTQLWQKTNKKKSIQNKNQKLNAPFLFPALKEFVSCELQLKSNIDRIWAQLSGYCRVLLLLLLLLLAVSWSVERIAAARSQTVHGGVLEAGRVDGLGGLLVLELLEGGGDVAGRRVGERHALGRVECVSMRSNT